MGQDQDDYLNKIIEKAATIIGSDYRNLGVIDAALKWQQQKISELKGETVHHSSPEFTCPWCGGHDFGTEVRIDEASKTFEVTGYHCHGQSAVMKDPCDWSGPAEACGMAGNGVQIRLQNDGKAVKP